jgi:transaldolase
MKFFIDTANVAEIKEINDWGVLDGVTTNPSLIAKEGRDFKEVIKEISSIVNGPISAEVVSMDHEGMVAEAEDLVPIHENIVIKVPMTDEGLKAVKILSSKGVKTNVTLVFSANQALLAAKAGASFVSPFIGRLDDISNPGMDIVSDIAQIFTMYGIETEIITASVRHPMHVIDSAKMGAHIATVPYSVFKQMVKHPLTDIGIEKFLKDWESVTKK